MKYRSALYFLFTLLFLLVIPNRIYAGTLKPYLIKDFQESIESSVAGLCEFDNKFYFRTRDSTYGQELWVTDGTEDGTYMVKDIYEGSESSNPYNCFLLEDKFVFAATESTGRYLWVSDGTEEGTNRIADLDTSGTASVPILSDGKVYFSATDGTNGYELWSTDGTGVGTVLVKDINTSINTGSFPSNFCVSNMVLYFSAASITGNYELWKSDGTTAGTVLVKDITGNNLGSYPNQLVDLNGVVIFSSKGTNSDYELWRSDGTSEGTYLIKDINESTDSSPNDIVVSGDYVFFSALTDDYNLWRSDGTEEGTIMVLEFNDEYIDPFPFDEDIIPLSEKVFFFSQMENYEKVLMNSDGTISGSGVLKHVVEDSSYEYVEHLVTDGNELFFIKVAYSASEELDRFEVWKSDGTDSGTVLVSSFSIYDNSFRSLSSFFGILSNKFFLMLNSETYGQKLYAIDLSYSLESPTNITYSNISTNGLNILWEDNSSKEEGYILQKSLDGITYYDVADLESNTESYTVSNLSPNTKYWFRVYAYSEKGDSDYLTDSTGVYTLSSNPSSLTGVVLSNSSLRVYWNGDSTTYYVSTANLNSGWISSKSYTFTDLDCNTMYTVYIKGRNANNVETSISSITLTTSACSTQDTTDTDDEEEKDDIEDIDTEIEKISLNSYNDYSNDGKSLDVSSDQEITVKKEDSEVSIKLISTSSDYVTLYFSFLDEDVNVSVGSNVKYDIDSDGEDDIEIVVNSISDKNANITFKEVKGIADEEDTILTVPEKITKSSLLDDWRVIVLMVMSVLALVISIILMYILINRKIENYEE